MKKTVALPAILVAIFLLTGCARVPSTIQPFPTITNAPTSTSTAIPVCNSLSPDIAPFPAPKPAWCQFEAYGINIAFPPEWTVDAMGAWSQNRQFHLQLESGDPQTIGLIFTVTNLSIEQADQVLLEGDETSGPIPAVNPEETIIGREIKTIEEITFLALTTTHGDRTIQRYFWLGGHGDLLIFKLSIPQSDFGNSEYEQIIKLLEEVVVSISVSP